jgi:hypothetical protein
MSEITKEIYIGTVTKNSDNEDFILIKFNNDDYISTRFLGVLQSVDVNFFLTDNDTKVKIFPLCELNNEWVDLLNLPPILLMYIQECVQLPQISYDFTSYILEEDTPYYELAKYLKILNNNHKVLRKKFDCYLKIINLTFNDIYLHLYTNKKKLMVDSVQFFYLKR